MASRQLYFVFPFTRRRRERIFHTLWLYLVVACGVLILTFLALVEQRERAPSTATRPPPAKHHTMVEDFVEVLRERRRNQRHRWIDMDVPLKSPEHRVNVPIERPKTITKKPVHLPINVSVAFNKTEMMSLNEIQRSEKYHYENVIVHFDLKGAPPTVDYFLALLRLIQQSGATGVLIEWEDMFPWSGKLESAKSTHAYTVAEVRKILQTARDLKLEVIPLVQTFGHMEWILKYEEFRKYRESDSFPQVICLGNPEAVALAEEAVKQVVSIHREYDLKYFHIGADEAFQFGHCKESLELLSQPNWSLEDLALSHIRRIARYTREISGGAQILAWHDLLKSFPSSRLVRYNLNDTLQPVIWDYSEDLITMTNEDFEYFQKYYQKVWASSAFKGANNPAASSSDIRHYEKNNLSWLKKMRELRDKKMMRFEGVIITGWSRYDHMATLCEIWPIGTPSMVLNTQIALIGAQQRFDEHPTEIISKMAKKSAGRAQLLNCSYGAFEGCHFPGSAVYYLYERSWLIKLSSLEAAQTNDKVMGWFSRYNVKHNISQNWYWKDMTFLRVELDDLFLTAIKLEKEMRKLFHNETVDEFFFSNIDPALEKALPYSRALRTLPYQRTHPRRFFKIERLNLAKISKELELN